MPTTNPVPSQDPSDLLFNAGKLDEVLNGTGNSFTDRLGVARRTVTGMNSDFDAQLADAESDLNVYRADAAASAAEALGYLQTYRATSYGALASDPATDPLGNPPTVGDEYFNTTSNLLKRWNGTTWQASDINTANLAAPSGSSIVGYDTGTVQDVLDGAKSLQDYTALRAYTGRAKRIYITGQLVTAKPAGIAGVFQYDQTDTISSDNGGTIIVDASGRRWKRDISGEINARWFGDDGYAIQAAISAAKLVKAVYIPYLSGDWEVSAPIIIPNTAEYWGISIRGEKPSQMYESLASSRATVLRAIAPINCVLGNRATWSGISGYYNKVKDLSIAAAGFANYGYINGYQDTVEEVSITGAVIGGIINGSLTNSTTLNNVSSTHNRHGLILTGGAAGSTSTTTYVNGGRFRQNTSAGLVLCQAYGVKFQDTVIESNTGNGVETFTQTSGEDYASPLPFSGIVTFYNSYWENNGKIISNDGLVTLSDFTFERCSFTGKNAVNDFDFKKITGVKWKECTMLSVGGITMGDNCTYFEYEGRQTDTVPARFGASAANFGTIKTTSNGGRSQSKASYGKQWGYQYTKNSDAVLTSEEVANSVIRNQGQAAVDVYLTLPGSEMIQTYDSTPVTTSFTFLATTPQLANRFEFNVPAGAAFIFKGNQRTKIFVTSLVYGMSLRFTFFNIQGAPTWLVDEIHGTWSSS